MSYGNVGLSTPRGSGTSGYIQKNLSYIKPRDYRGEIRPQQQQQQQQKGTGYGGRLGGGLAAGSFEQGGRTRHREPNPEILAHEHKRAIESKVFDLRTRLEEAASLGEEEIDAKTEELRKTLVQALERSTTKAIASAEARASFQPKAHRDPNEESNRTIYKPHETHRIANAKAHESERMAKALGIDVDTFQEGEAFDREAQERKRAERQMRMEKERVEREVERERRRAVRDDSPARGHGRQRSSYEDHGRLYERGPDGRDEEPDRRGEETRRRRRRDDSSSRSPPPPPRPRRTARRSSSPPPKRARTPPTSFMPRQSPVQAQAQPQEPAAHFIHPSRAILNAPAHQHTSRPVQARRSPPVQPKPAARGRGPRDYSPSSPRAREREREYSPSPPRHFRRGSSRDAVQRDASPRRNYGSEAHRLAREYPSRDERRPDSRARDFGWRDREPAAEVRQSRGRSLSKSPSMSRSRSLSRTRSRSLESR